MPFNPPRFKDRVLTDFGRAALGHPLTRPRCPQHQVAGSELARNEIGGVMPMVKIKCPKTGRDVPTGIVMDLETFQSVTFTNNSVSCPYCGEAHVWSKPDAFLE